MSLKNFGYKEITIQHRAMTIGDLFVGLAKEILTNDDVELTTKIRINEIKFGDCTTFDNYQQMLTSSWDTTWHINLIHLKFITELNHGKEEVILYAVMEDAEEE